MKKWIPQVLIAMVLSLVETSFFASFHGMIRFTPFVLVISVYLLQHHGLKSAAWWMIIHGMILDMLGIASVPFITIPFLLAAWVAFISAEHLFSNRSFYGVLACSLMSFLTYEIGLGFLQEIHSFFTKIRFHWGVYFLDAWYRLIMLLIFLIALFAFAKQIRRLLVKYKFIASMRQTY